VSRILLVGRGPLPSPTTPTGGFAQLRTQHFFDALVGAGHDVRLVLLEGEHLGEVPTQWGAVICQQDEGPGWLERMGALGDGADAVITAGPYTPGRAGVAAAGAHTPLWADVPGDPFAELEAVRVATGAVPAARLAAAHAAIQPVLARADRLSAVSQRQRFALQGQLGLTGRLDGVDRVHCIPIAFDLPFPRGTPRVRGPNDPLTVALCGAFNPWLDVEGLIAALDTALTARRAISVVVTGGPVPGLPTDSWRRFQAWAACWPERVRVLGWVPHGDLPAVLSTAHVGLFLDRPEGREPELGDRTRALLFAWLALEVVASTRTERLADLAARGLITGVDNAASAAQALIVMTDTGSDGKLALGDALATDSDPTKLAAPLLAWAAAPDRAPPTLDPIAALAQDRDALRSELAQVHATPTWRLLSRIHRWTRIR
jgi:hypothetical protein